MDNKEIKYKGENFSFYWNPKNKIIFVINSDTYTKETAESFKAKFTDLLEKIPKEGGIKILSDNTKHTWADKEARKIFIALIRNLLQKYADLQIKIAVCGANVVLTALNNFLLKPLLNRKNTKSKFFTNTEEGISWLKNKN